MSRANPIKGTIEPVPGMPKHVVIYRIPASSVWWTRCYTADKRYLVRSTKTDSKREAHRFARQLFTDSLTQAVSTGNLNPKTIRAVAMSLLAQEKASAKDSLYTKDRNMVENTILPHFGNRFLGDITHQDLNDFLAKLRAKKLSPATKKHYMGLLGKVFNHGIQLKVIAHRPLFPKLGEKLQTAEKRDYLTVDEYGMLSKTILEMEKAGATYRGTPITAEYKLLANFMVNSFIRPPDLRVLKHKHVERRYDKKTDQHWLVLNHPATKTTADPVHTMPNCVHYYDELIAFRKKQVKDGKASSEYLDPNDYLFMPDFENRTTAMGKLGKIFAEIIKRTKLGETTGKNLTLYSLRHTAIMYRLEKGDVDTLTLAKNARTSQAVIEKFYGAHLTTEQARVRLHSFAPGQGEQKPRNKAPRKVETARS
jgi:integrase